LDDVVAAGARRYDLCPFDPPQVEAFAEAWFRARTLHGAQEEAGRFVAQILDPPLAELVSSPLLATIAAVVFEAHPGRGIPADVVGLYDEFVRILLVDRRRRPHPVQAASPRQWMVAHGTAGANLADWLRDNVGLLLEHVAHLWYFDSRRPVLDVALSWLAAVHPSPLYASAEWPSLLRLVLTETGVLVARGAELAWFHLSFAEYYASAVLARDIDARQWAWLGADYTTANLGRLALLRKARAGDNLAVLLRQMIRAGTGSGDTLRECLGPTGPLDEATLRRLARYAIRRSLAHEFVNLAPFVVRPSGLTELRRAARGRWLRPRSRVISADTLARHGAGADVAVGCRALLAVTRSRRVLLGTRVHAASNLAEALDRRGSTGDSGDDEMPPEATAALTEEIRLLLPRLLTRPWLYPTRRYFLVTGVRAGLDADTRQALLRRIARNKRGYFLARVFAAEALIEAGDADGGVAVLRAFAAGRSRKRSKWRAAEALAEHDPETALPILRKAVTESKESYDRLKAATQLTRYDRSEGIAALQTIIKGSTVKVYDRASALEELYRTGETDLALGYLPEVVHRATPIRAGQLVSCLCLRAEIDPRTLRPLLLALHTTPGLLPHHRRRVRRLLNVLGGPTDAGTRP
jgi:hypothetical protein